MNVVRRPFESRRAAQSFSANSFSMKCIKGYFFSFVFICIHQGPSICLKSCLSSAFVFRFNFFFSFSSPSLSPVQCASPRLSNGWTHIYAWVKRCCADAVCWFSVVFVHSLFRRNWMKIYDSFRSSHTRPTREHCSHTHAHSAASYTTGHSVYSINRRGKSSVYTPRVYRRVPLPSSVFFLFSLPFAVFTYGTSSSLASESV